VRHANKVLWTLAILIFIPVVYILLLGPLGGLFSRNLMPYWAWEAYVYPLDVLGLTQPESSVGQALSWYIEFWAP
jgi:hypothetical protein